LQYLNYKTTNININNIDFNSSVVYKHLRQLKPKTSSGPDGLSALFLKNLSSSLALPLSILFKLSFSSGILPDIWKSAIITPIFKKGQTCDPGNYRPISLTCVLCKLMESVIKDNLIKHLYDNKLITKHQHGFLTKHSTCSQLLECVNDWSIALNFRNSVDVVYIDFCKAFDSVVHSKLLYKLKAYGINGLLLQWITNFLNNRSQSVRVGSCVSDFSAVISGVPQGSVLGPILFLVYINDLVDLFGPDVTVKLYVDDAKVYINIVDIASINTLQDALFSISRWATLWQLKISINKCSVLHLGKNNLLYDYAIDSVTLPNVRDVRDLGVIIDSRLSFSAHYAQIVSKAHQRAGMITRCFKSKDAHLLFRAFATYVRPLLEYCSPVWSPVYKCDIAKLESVQRRFTKKLKGLHELCYLDRLDYLKAETLEKRRLKQDLIMMYKIMHNYVDIDINELFYLNGPGVTRGHNFKLVKPLCFNNSRLHSFSCRRINCWNNLHYDIVNLTALNNFKNAIDNVDLTNYLIYTH